MQPVSVSNPKVTEQQAYAIFFSNLIVLNLKSVIDFICLNLQLNALSNHCHGNKKSCPCYSWRNCLSDWGYYSSTAAQWVGIRAPASRYRKSSSVQDRLLYRCSSQDSLLLRRTTYRAVFLELLQATVVIKEAPTDEVEASTEFAAEFLRRSTLAICSKSLSAVLKSSSSKSASLARLRTSLSSR